MRVFSKIACGFRTNTGKALLQKGLNVLVEPLSSSERAFIAAMVKAKIAEEVSEQVPAAPVSETHLTVAPRAPDSHGATTASIAPKPMRRRKAAR